MSSVDVVYVRMMTLIDQKFHVAVRFVVLKDFLKLLEMTLVVLVGFLLLGSIEVILFPSPDSLQTNCCGQ